MTGHVSREVFCPADGKAYLVDVRPGTVEGRQREDGVFVVSGVIHIEYLLCYGVQWDERLYFRLLSVDAEVRKWTDNAYKDAKSLISKNKATVERIAKALLDKETLSGDEIREIVLGKKTNSVKKTTKKTNAKK